MMPSYLWFAGAILLLLLELFVSGAVLLCFAVAFAMTGVVAVLGGGFLFQLAALAVFTVVAFVGMRPTMLKYLHSRRPPVETNYYALIGQEAHVTEEIIPGERRGQVRVGGEEWGALSADSRGVPAGTTVRVKEVSGNKLIIERLN